ncbi:hypothetical protein [Chryseobacterium gossypii]|uniref:hypothetical protein n=1 Tax=Chryseobacterium gossypii TaxID=3231602 RepID=UPI003523C64E
MNVVNASLSKCFLIFILLLFKGELIFCQEFNPQFFDDTLLKENESLRLLGEYKKLVRLNQEYLKEARKNRYTEGEVLCYINLANICGTIGEYGKGLEYLKKCESKLKRSDKPLYARVYQEYGQLNSVLGLHANALYYNSKALFYIRDVNLSDRKKYFLDKVFSNRADFLYQANRPDSSLIYFHKALRTINDPVTKALIAKHHLYYTSHTDSTFIYLQEAMLQLPPENSATVKNALVNLVYGDYYSKKGDYEKALEHYKIAAKDYIKTKRVYNVPGVYQSIADTYKILNNSAEQQLYLKKFAEARQNLDNIQNEAINKSIDNLLSEKEESTERYLINILIYVLFFSLLLLILVYIFFKNYKRTKARNEQLAKEQEALKDKLKNDSFEELINLVKNNDPAFLERFRETYPGFVEKLLQINPKLSSSDLIFCAMLRLNFSSKEIASYTSVQHKSIQQKKYRIRKKLGISGGQDLFLFFKNLD